MENKGNNGTFMDMDMMEKYHEQRKANMKLLAERRELLLQLQRANREHSENAHLCENCNELKRKVEKLERKLQLQECKQTKEEVSENPSLDLDPNATAVAPGDATCNCQCSEKLKETVKVNHQWNDAFQRSVNQCHEMDKKLQRMEKELRAETEENVALKELVFKLENDLKDLSRNDYKRITSLEDVCTKDDVEALKLQMLTYQEDFKTEKEEKQEIIQKNKQLQRKLEEANSSVQSLSDQIVQCKYVISRLSHGPEPIQRQYRRLPDDDFNMRPRYNRQLSPSLSYPMNAEDLLTRSPTPAANPLLRRSDSDLFKGGNVVRDNNFGTILDSK